MISIIFSIRLTIDVFDSTYEVPHRYVPTKLETIFVNVLKVQKEIRRVFAKHSNMLNVTSSQRRRRSRDSKEQTSTLR